MKRERSGGGSKMNIAYLLLCVLMVSAHSLDVEIDINVDKTKETSHSYEHLDFRYRGHPELNPCKNKKCDEGEKCHVVRNPVMLQLPIARCEKEVLDEAAVPDDGCPNFLLASNNFQCKTEIEWRGLAKKQCQIRVGATVETVLASVRYPCRFGRRSSGVRVFQQVEVSCCKLSSSTLQPTATDEVVKSMSPTKDSVTEPMETDAPTSWEKWEDTSDWDYTDFGGTDSTWPAPAEGENQLPSTTQTSKMPPTKNSEASPVSDITPPQNDPVGTITEATDAVVTSVSPTKEAMTTQGYTAPTDWDKWGETSDWDYTDFSGNSDDLLWPVPAEDEDASQTPPTTMPPPKYTETPPPLKVSDITPPQNDPVGAITKDVPTQDPPRNHHHLMWFIFPSVAIATLCSMACLTFCLVRACMVRRRLRRAYKSFPADPPQRILANGSYNDSEEEDELYSKPNTGVGGYEPAVKPNLIFRNDSSGDMLAYDMFIAGQQQ